jgi:transposase, IS605 orfB family
MLTTVKYRIYPNQQQVILIHKTIGYSRLIYNLMLHDFYENDLIKSPAKYKNEYPFLKEVDSLALANSQMDLKQAFRNYKNNKEHFGKPKFKKKTHSKLSYKTNNQKGTIRIENNKLILPKFKSGIKIVMHRLIEGMIKSVTIEQVPCGYYTASILYDVPDTQEKPTLSKENIVGIDLGLTHLAITSDHKKYENPKHFHKLQDKLRKEQQTLSRRQEQNIEKRIYDDEGKVAKTIYKKPLRDCKNYQKQKRKVAKIYNKIKHQRLDNLHKVSHEIVKNHDYIVVETLKIQNLMKNRKLSKSIADVGWSMFINMIRYKTERYGKELIQIDQWYPSSQICSNCHQNEGKKALSVREWTCTHCHTKHDRDINAAINIRNKGLELIS